MANYYYVDSNNPLNGNAVANTTVVRADAFSAMTDTVYAAIQDVITYNTFVAGDHIRCADNHHKNYGATTTFNFTTNVTLTSVDSLHCEQYKKGAAESSQEVTGNSFYIASIANGIITFNGFTLKSGDELNVAQGDGSISVLNNCDLYTYRNGGSFIQAQGDTAAAILNNCSITMSHVNHYLYVDGGSYLQLNYCSVHREVTTIELFSSGRYGGVIDLNYCDLSDAKSSELFSTSSDNTNFRVNFNKVKIYDSFLSGASKIAIKSTMLDNTEYYNSIPYWDNGEITTDKLIFLTDFSISLDANSGVTTENPLSHRLLSIPAQDLTTSKDIKINILTDDITLTDSNFWLIAYYNSNADLELANKASTLNVDMLAAGSNLDTNAETWSGTSGFTNPVEQEVTVTIPELSNVDNGVVDIYVNLARPDTTVWVCPDYVVT